MSLEDKIDKLTATMEALNVSLAEVIGLSKNAGSTSTADAGSTAETTKPKTKAKDKAADTADATTISKEFGQVLAGWLGEFAKEADKENPDGAHPEVTARKGALKKAFTTLGVTKLGEINTADQVKKLTDWFEKAKAVDKGFGAGRFVADPAATADADDDGLGLD